MSKAPQKKKARQFGWNDGELLMGERQDAMIQEGSFPLRSGWRICRPEDPMNRLVYTTNACGYRRFGLADLIYAMFSTGEFMFM